MSMNIGFRPQLAFGNDEKKNVSLNNSALTQGAIVELEREGKAGKKKSSYYKIETKVDDVLLGQKLTDISSKKLKHGAKLNIVSYAHDDE